MRFITLFIILSFLLRGGAVAQADSIRKYIIEGESHFDRGNFQQALKSYTRASDFEKTSEYVNVKLAEIYYHLKDFNRSLYHSNQIDFNGSYTVFATKYKALSIYSLGDTLQAYNVFEENLQKHPSIFTYHYYAELLLKNKKLDKAEQIATIGFVNDSGFNPCTATLGKIYVISGRPAHGILLFEHAYLFERESAKKIEYFNTILEALKQKDSSSKDTLENLFSLRRLQSVLFIEKQIQENAFLNFNTDLINRFISIYGSNKESKFHNLALTYGRLVKNEMVEPLTYYILKYSKKQMVLKWLNHNPQRVKDLMELIGNSFY